MVVEDNIFQEHLSEPWFSLLYFGAKKFEGRLYKNRFKNYKIGDTIQWYNDDYKHIVITSRIVNIYMTNTFEEFLKDEYHLKGALPGICNLKEGIQVYRNFYMEENEKKYGVIFFELE